MSTRYKCQFYKGIRKLLNIKLWAIVHCVIYGKWKYTFFMLVCQSILELPVLKGVTVYAQDPEVV